MRVDEGVDEGAGRAVDEGPVRLAREMTNRKECRHRREFALCEEAVGCDTVDGA